MKSVSAYAAAAAILATALTALTFALNATGMLALPAVMYSVPACFALMTIALYANVRASASKSAQRFVTAFMASVTVKLLVTAAFLGIYIYIRKDEKVPVALGTFAVYVLFTVLYVRYLLIQLGEKSGKSA
jgi:hypothetical protein